MVEGPGCKLKGEKIRSKVCGQRVVKVSGSAVESTKKQTSSKKADDRQKLLDLEALRLEEVQTLGKELFMFFGNVCLRVHFLMNGSFRINNKQTDPDSTGKKVQGPSLVLQMSQDCLAFYESAVDIRSSSLCRAKHEELKTLDICSPVFSQKRALEVIQSLEPTQTLCDVLLDQSVLPGVGNIIKNEALFDSGLKPDTKVCDLKEEHLVHLIKMTRDFSMLFYQCRKTGQALSKYYKVYGQEICGQCKTKVVICRMGEVTDRLTYFCPECQTNDLKLNRQRLPQKNSLLGWFGPGATSSMSTSPSPEWSCSQCTLINRGTQKTCSVCLTPRAQGDKTDPPKQLNKPGEATTLTPSLQNTRNNSQTTSAKRKSDSAGFQPMTQNPPKRRKSEGNLAKENTDLETVSSQFDKKYKIPLCAGHGRKCFMKEVRKEGQNFKRMFFTCSLPRGKQCQYFKWADESFPICPGHGKPGSMRTVLKQGPNNGRKFFACSFPKNKQCNFFEWAEGYG